MKELIKTYLRYGVLESFAKVLEEKGISKTTFEKVPKQDLIKFYGLEPKLVHIVKLCVKRKPIDELVMQELLEKNAFSCCLCKQSTPFIIHHIIEYSKNQNNSYDNLAVLCLEHHNQVHNNTLTHKITAKEIRNAKTNWEKEVKKHSKKVAENFSKLKVQNDSNFHYSKYSINKSGAYNEKIDIKISLNTTFILKVEQEVNQEFVVYLSIKTDQNEQKWVAFATVASINNRVFRDSEFVFRVGRSGNTNYKIVENVMEKINESGLDFKGIPTSIDIIRFRGINDTQTDFYYEFKES